MKYEFMTADTLLPPSMPFSTALVKTAVSNTAKVIYCLMLDAVLSDGLEDENGILFVQFPVADLASALSKSSMTVKRALKELESKGMILRVSPGIGKPNLIYVLVPGEEDALNG